MKRLLLLFASGSLLLACDSGTQPVSAAPKEGEMSRVTGTVSYRERILLRPGSRLEVVLEDVSRADAPAVQVARVERTDPGQVPIAFELEYQPELIDSRMSYAIRARIFGPDGRLLFLNDTRIPVITREAGNEVEVLLVSAQRNAAAATQPQAPSGAGEEPGGMDLRGQFSYRADAANFRDCNSGKVFPVEMSGQFPELERAYLNSGTEAGKGLTVNLRGRYLERSAMETDSMEIKLIIDEFKSISDNQDCTPAQHADLFNTYWKLVELDGKPVQQNPDGGQQREAHMVLDANEHRVSGHGGCNRFFGEFTNEGDKLVFTGLGSTMMACVAGMETEQAYLLALGETNRAQVSGQLLQLFKDAHSLARFEAVYF